MFVVLSFESLLKIDRVSALNGVLQFLTDFFMIRTSYKSLCDQIFTYVFMVHMLLAYNCDQLSSQSVTIAARLMMFFFMASALVLNHLCFEISRAQDVHNFLFRGELFTYSSTDRLKVIISLFVELSLLSHDPKGKGDVGSQEYI